MNEAQMAKIKIIRSGGQSGVDRAALDAARSCKIKICGWCPKGGWAEDYPDPPGILALYPELKETPSARVEQRTVWNVRDADATLIIDPTQLGTSPGTTLTAKAAKAFGKPCLVVRSENSVQEVMDWLAGLGDELILNVAGPRESECGGAYAKTAKLLTEVFRQQITRTKKSDVL